MKRINLLNTRTIAISALALVICFMATSVSFADEGKEGQNKKVTVEYQYVTKDEVSSGEISHLTKGLPDISAKENAKYLMVYEGNSGKTNTGDSSKLPIWLICVAAGGAAIFFISRKKMNSSTNAKVSMLLVAGLVTSVPAAGLMEAKAYTSNKLNKYNFTQTLNIGDKLFKNMPKVEAGAFMGVIDTADLNKPAGNTSTPADTGSKKPDATKPDSGNKPSLPDKPVVPDQPSKPDQPVVPDKPSNPDKPLPGEKKYKDGVYKGIGGGFYDTDPDRRMEVEITVKDNKITDFRLVKFGDDKSFEDSYKNFENKFLPKIKADINEVPKIYDSIINWLKRKTADYIDVATGATYSNRGVMAAIKDALKQAENASSGQDTANKVKDLIFTKQPKSAILHMGDGLKLNEFELAIRYWDSTPDAIVKMNDLEKYGIEVNIPDGTIINKENIKMDENRFFDIIFKHKESKKQISTRFQVEKRTVYDVRPLKEFQITFADGTRATLPAKKDDFNYKLEVTEEQYKGIKEVIAKDSKNETIEQTKSFIYNHGICYITLKNNVVEKELVKEKDRKFDNFNITLISKGTKKPDTEDEDKPDEQDQENPGDVADEEEGEDSTTFESSNGKLILDVDDDHKFKFAFNSDDEDIPEGEKPVLEENKKSLFNFVSDGEFDYLGGNFKEIFGDVIKKCESKSTNFDEIEKKAKGLKVKPDAPLSTKILYESMLDVLEQFFNSSETEE
ncbi:FMN-binding protein [Eubacteriales bacterium KG127]